LGLEFFKAAFLFIYLFIYLFIKIISFFFFFFLVGTFIAKAELDGFHESAANLLFTQAFLLLLLLLLAIIFSSFLTWVPLPWVVSSWKEGSYGSLQ